jgi:hypothetical protein
VTSKGSVSRQPGSENGDGAGSGVFARLWQRLPTLLLLPFPSFICPFCFPTWPTPARDRRQFSARPVTSDPHVVVVLPQFPAFLSETVFKVFDPFLGSGDLSGDPGLPPHATVNEEDAQSGE